MFKYLSLIDWLNSEAQKYARGVRRSVLKSFSEYKKKPRVRDYPATVVACSNRSDLVKEKSAMLFIGNTDVSFANTVKTLLGHPIGAKLNGNVVGDCAEQRAVNKYYLRGKRRNFESFVFSDAIRPRTMQVVKNCRNCKSLFPQLWKSIR